MGFLICCDNKGCYQTTEATLNTKTDQVHCGACGEVIKGVTSFTKIQMKSLGQIMKNQKASTAFAVPCPVCGKKNTPILNKQTNKLTCPSCNADVGITLPAPTAQAIRMHLGGKL
jgi:ribosomal protein S27E